MRLLWTKSKLPTGPLITWGLEEPVSHFQVEFFDSIVLQSNFFGVHIGQSKDNFRWCHVVYEKKIDISFALEASLFAKIIIKRFGAGYDWEWFWKMVKHALIFKITRKPMPDEIKSRSSDKFLCTEVVEFLEPVIGKVSVGNGSPFLLAKALGAVK